MKRAQIAAGGGEAAPGIWLSGGVRRPRYENHVADAFQGTARSTMSISYMMIAVPGSCGEWCVPRGRVQNTLIEPSWVQVLLSLSAREGFAEFRSSAAMAARVWQGEL